MQKRVIHFLDKMIMSCLLFQMFEKAVLKPFMNSDFVFPGFISSKLNQKSSYTKTFADVNFTWNHDVVYHNRFNDCGFSAAKEYQRLRERNL